MLSVVLVTAWSALYSSGHVIDEHCSNDGMRCDWEAAYHVFKCQYTAVVACM